MNTKNSPEQPNEIVITRTFDAPRELVWEAMTDPGRVAQWWGPVGFTTKIEEMDVRPGGVWKHVMRGPDGTEYPNRSVFKEVVRPERISYSHGGAKRGGPPVRSEATWTFDEAEGGKTTLTLRMVFPSAEERDRVVREYNAVEGGKQTLGRLAEQLAKTPIVVERTFDAPVGMVWKAITVKEEMVQWYMTKLEAFEARVGFETRFDVVHEERHYVHVWNVTEAAPEKRIAYRWRFEGYPGESMVTFELFPEGERTRLRVTHAGLETFEPEKNPFLGRGNFQQGWTMILESWLKEYVEEIAPYADRTFVISRTFDAPRELVWEAWTEPERMALWWGPHDFTTPVCELDVRPGGAFLLVMRAQDGREFPAKGVYREVVKPERLVMAMDCSEHPEAWHDMVNPDRDKTRKPVLELLQTVTFDAKGDKTELTIRARFESAAIRDGMIKAGMNEGWPESLERLAEVLGGGCR